MGPRGAWRRATGPAERRSLAPVEADRRARAGGPGGRTLWLEES